MTKREYAVSLGLATMGRGRLSREAHAAIAKAEAEGMVFDDAKPITVKHSAPKPAKPVTVKQEPVAREYRETTFNVPIDTLFVGEDSKGKKHTVNARQVCRNSGYSMTTCPCGRDHEVLVSSMEFVTVKRK